MRPSQAHSPWALHQAGSSGDTADQAALVQEVCYSSKHSNGGSMQRQRHAPLAALALPANNGDAASEVASCSACRRLGSPAGKVGGEPGGQWQQGGSGRPAASGHPQAAGIALCASSAAQTHQPEPHRPLAGPLGVAGTGPLPAPGDQGR